VVPEGRPGINDYYLFMLSGEWTRAARVFPCFRLPSKFRKVTAAMEPSRNDFGPSKLHRKFHISWGVRWRLLAIGLSLVIGLQQARAQGLPASIANFSFPNPSGTAVIADSNDAFAGSAGSVGGREDVSWKTVPMDVLRDQKHVWLFPVQLARGHHLVPTLAIVGLTTGLVVADRYDMPYFYHTTEFNRFSETFNKSSTEAMMAAVPASLYVFGLAKHDNYAEQTAILSAEAYIDSAIPHVAIKFVARRLRPDSPQLNGNYSDTFFRSNVSVFSNGSSFPSGHAAGAFSVATVIARRYGSHRWVPWASYGVATLLSFSRIPSREHYPSDVFLGAVLGYTITRNCIFREE